MIEGKKTITGLLKKKALLILTSLLLINLAIFIFRDNGFDYKDYADGKELNYSCNSACKESWSLDCYHFSTEEKKIAREILQKEIGLDTISSEIAKVKAINVFLYNSVGSGNRNKPFLYNSSEPIKMFQYAKENANVNLLCGRASIINYLFCISAGLPVRTIQAIQYPNGHLSPDSHVFNEVWIEQAGKWCYTDFYRNRMLVYKDGNPLAASDFFDDLSTNETHKLLELSIVPENGGLLTEREVQRNDKYMNPDYFLAYFKKCDPAEIYTWKNRIKHYLLPVSHFKIYKEKYSWLEGNVLFYLKEFFLIVFIAYLFYSLITIPKSGD